MSQLPEITCDRCVAPGTCCKAFPLSAEFGFGVTIEAIRKWLADCHFPFEPLRRSDIYCQADDTNDPNSRVRWKEKWLFRCTKLGEDGRCTIYEDRPELCKKYQPGSDAMCVHMRMPNGEPIIPLLLKVEGDQPNADNDTQAIQ